MNDPSVAAALAGVGLSLIGLFIQAALFAFFLGKLSARVGGLEAHRRFGEDNAAALAAITATLHALKDSVDDIRATFARRFEAVEENVQTLMLMPRRARRSAAEG
jgi:hypothetical protein